MSDADELARRYLALWTDYLTALVSDPQAAELLRRWIAFTTQFAQVPGERSGNSFSAWPPTPASARPPADAAPAAGASRQRGDAVDELARRVDELERRLAALEPRPRPTKSRRRAGTGGS